MDFDYTDTQKKIIDTALRIIGVEGNLNVTVREIASEAGVNLASINYYFRSKDNLLSEIENCFSSYLIDNEKVFFDESLPPKERIIIWAERLMTLFFKYPGIILMAGSKILLHEKIGYTLGERIYGDNAVLSKLVAVASNLSDPKLITMKTTQIISGMINPIIMQFGICSNPQIDFNNESTRREYITSFVYSILSK